MAKTTGFGQWFLPLPFTSVGTDVPSLALIYQEGGFVMINFLNWLDGVLWGVPLIVLMAATGAYFTIRSGFFQSDRHIGQKRCISVPLAF